LPGTHTKWVQIRAGKVTRFSTFMTGELFDLLRKKSVLRHSVSERGWDANAFDRAIREGISKGSSISQELFSIRSASLLNGPSPVEALSRLSGLLIGSELSAVRALWSEQEIIVVGEEEISQAYTRALSLNGVSASTVSSDMTTRAGLVSIFTNLRQSA